MQISTKLTKQQTQFYTNRCPLRPTIPAFLDCDTNRASTSPSPPAILNVMFILLLLPSSTGQLLELFELFQ